jgi:hypothetical protein
VLALARLKEILFMILLGILLGAIFLLGKEETSAAGWFFICLVVLVVLVLI